MAEQHLKPVSEHEARQVAEEAREGEWKAPSFLKQIFLGNFRLDLVHPFPEAPPDTLADQLTDPHIGKGGFLDLFGRPSRESSCECERRIDLS